MSTYARQIAFLGILFVSIFSIVHSDVVTFRQCPQENPDAPSNCTIHEVRITPCKGGGLNKECRLKRGYNASLEFDYTPNFDAATLEGKAFWTTPTFDFPFGYMERNACLGTPCPVVSNKKQTYHQEFPILKQYPIRTFDVKWMVVSPEEQSCCFIFQIKIQK